jgi:hypothetical protein
MFQILLNKSDDDVKKSIKETLNSYDNVIVVNNITHNKINPFDTKEIIIECSHIVKTFEAFRLINESNYKTELPNQEMIEWFDFEFNREPENIDDLESDMWSSEQQKDFIDEFRKELDGLSYSEVIDIFYKAKNMSY